MPEAAGGPSGDGKGEMAGGIIRAHMSGRRGTGVSNLPYLCEIPVRGDSSRGPSMSGISA